MQCFFYICEYLEITPAEFFTSKMAQPAKIRSAFDAMLKLTDKQQDLVCALIQELGEN